MKRKLFLSLCFGISVLFPSFAVAQDDCSFPKDINSPAMQQSIDACLNSLSSSYSVLMTNINQPLTDKTMKGFSTRVTANDKNLETIVNRFNVLVKQCNAIENAKPDTDLFETMMTSMIISGLALDWAAQDIQKNLTLITLNDNDDEKTAYRTYQMVAEKYIDQAIEQYEMSLLGIKNYNADPVNSQKKIDNKYVKMATERLTLAKMAKSGKSGTKQPAAKNEYNPCDFQAGASHEAILKALDSCHASIDMTYQLFQNSVGTDLADKTPKGLEKRFSDLSVYINIISKDIDAFVNACIQAAEKHLEPKYQIMMIRVTVLNGIVYDLMGIDLQKWLRMLNGEYSPEDKQRVSSMMTNMVQHFIGARELYEIGISTAEQYNSDPLNREHLIDPNYVKSAKDRLAALKELLKPIDALDLK